MSEEKVESPEEVKSVSVEEFNELRSQFESLSASKDRILNESKDNKSKYQSLRKEAEDKERTDMEAKEQWKELLEAERNKSYELENKYKSVQKKAVLNNVNFEVSRLAQDAFDANDVINSLRLTEDNIDVETGEVKGISVMVDDLRKNKPYLFKSSVPAMNTKNPHYREEKTAISREDSLLGAIKFLTKK